MQAISEEGLSMQAIRGRGRGPVCTGRQKLGLTIPDIGGEWASVCSRTSGGVSRSH
jgi:hypothetical protein